MGVPVSRPLRACERYHAAWLSLKADFGNCALTVATSSSLVMTLFAVIASMTTCLMVRLDSGAEGRRKRETADAFLSICLFQPYQFEMNWIGKGPVLIRLQ